MFIVPALFIAYIYRFIESTKNDVLYWDWGNPFIIGFGLWTLMHCWELYNEVQRDQ